MNAKKAKLIKKTVLKEMYETKGLTKPKRKNVYRDKEFKSINRGRKRHYMKTGSVVL